MILRRIRNWLVVFLNKRRVPVPLLQKGVLLIFQDRSNRTWKGSWKISMDIIAMKWKLMIFNGEWSMVIFIWKNYINKKAMCIFHSVKIIFLCFSVFVAQIIRWIFTNLVFRYFFFSPVIHNRIKIFSPLNINLSKYYFSKRVAFNSDYQARENLSDYMDHDKL